METVRYIFDRYVAGAGSTMIARELNEQGISTIKGNPWTSSSVMGIINNEKYKGDILLGKTFTVDPISKERWKILEKKIGFTSKIIMNRLYQKKNLQELRRYGNAVMEDAKRE